MRNLDEQEKRNLRRASACALAALLPTAMLFALVAFQARRGWFDVLVVALAIAAMFFAFRAAWGYGYRAALDDAIEVVNAPSKRLAEAQAAADEAEQALRAGAGPDDPRVVRARRLIDDLTP